MHYHSFTWALMGDEDICSWELKSCWDKWGIAACSKWDPVFSSFSEAADTIEQSFDKGWNSQHDLSSKHQLPRSPIRKLKVSWGGEALWDGSMSYMHQPIIITLVPWRIWHRLIFFWFVEFLRNYQSYMMKNKKYIRWGSKRQQLNLIPRPLN
jgi:hypothetical protein